jgi:hypothetical protein
MALIAKNSGGGDFERQLVEVGQHQFVLSKIFDLGLQQVEWQGETKFQHKVMFVYEMDERIDDENSEYHGKRLLMHEELTLSLGDKAKLLERLQTWRGKELTDSEREAFDLEKVLGVNGTMNVMHKTSKRSGRDYAVVASLAPVLKGATPMVPELEDDWCPDWIKEKISRGFPASPGSVSTPSNDPPKVEDVPF